MGPGFTYYGYMHDTPILIHTRGGGGALGQIARIAEGLAAQPGVRLTDDPRGADLVYVNDPSCYEDVLRLKRAGELRGKLILNVLDIPEHCMPPNGDYVLDKLFALKERLGYADAITAISHFTQSQLHRYLNLGSYLVGNPIKDVTLARRLAGERPYPYRVLMAGRTNDPNKRIRTIGIGACLMAGLNEDEVAVVGGEYPGWGTNLGVVSDDQLNDLYNSVDFVMQPTLNTGLELPPLEGMVCGAVPLICYDLSTFPEMPYPRFWGCYPSATAVAYRLRNLMGNPELLAADRAYCLEEGEGIQERFGKHAVAARIVAIYQKLVAPPIP